VNTATRTARPKTITVTRMTLRIGYLPEATIVSDEEPTVNNVMIEDFV
jgi:hypothetical protein